MTILILGVVAYLLVLFVALSLCWAAGQGDRQMRAAVRDRHLRSLP